MAALARGFVVLIVLAMFAALPAPAHPERTRLFAATAQVRATLLSGNGTPGADTALTDIGADRVWSMVDKNGQPIQGEHVAIGIVDFGIDLRSPEFRNPDGTTRSKYLWDQTATRGTPPAPYTFGRECTAATINAGTCPEVDKGGQGTAVAGIAAGNGRSDSPPRYSGVAPQADILIVKSYAQDTASVIAAWKYLITRAGQLGEPIVINNSFGLAEGPHDGSESLAQAIDAFSGPGRIFVTSAGDAHLQGDHVHGFLRSGHPATQQLVLPHPAGVKSVSANLYYFYPAADAVSVDVMDVAAHQNTPIVPQDGYLRLASFDHRRAFAIVDSGEYDSRFHETLVQVIQYAKGTRRYRITLRGTDLVGRARYDVWKSQDQEGGFLHADPTDSLMIPGDAQQVITVGSYVAQGTWTDLDGKDHRFFPSSLTGRLDPNSSFGPTASGEEKPDLAAPGAIVIAPLSTQVKVCSRKANCLARSDVTSDGHHLVAAGSEYAAPYVSGTIALMLQADPSLDPATADSILRATADHDAATGTAAWSPGLGAGKLDAFAAVQRVLTAPAPVAGPAPPPLLPPAEALRLAGVVIGSSNRDHKHIEHLPGLQAVRGQYINLSAAVDVYQPVPGPVTWDFRLVSPRGTLYQRRFNRNYGQADFGDNRSVQRDVFLPRSAPPGTYRFTARLMFAGVTQSASRVVSVR